MPLRLAESIGGPGIAEPEQLPDSPERSQPATVIDITVVIALTDHRGWTVRAVESWNAQTYPRKRIALHLLHDGRGPDFDALLPPYLHPQDLLQCAPGLSEIALYDLGIRNARTDRVFIAEPHVEPDPSTAGEMVRYLRETGFSGAACHSEGCPENNFVGRMEDAVFARDLAVKGDESHWNKIFLRGCCLSRAAYLDCGGLDYRFGHFAEPLLGARLRDKGYRLGLACRAVCRHHGTDRFTRLIEDLREYGENEARCCLSLDPAFEARYFGVQDALRAVSCLHPSMALGLLRRQWSAARASPNASVLPPLVAGQIAHSPRVRRIWQSAALGCLVLLIHALRWRPDTAAGATGRLWRLAIERGRDSAILAQRRAARVGRSPPLLPASALGPYDSLGFHGLEWRDRTAFRWTCGAAVVLLNLPTGRHRVTVGILSLRPVREAEWVSIELAGFAMRRVLEEKDSEIHLDVDIPAGRERARPLYIVSTRLGPFESNPADARTLGIACSFVAWRQFPA